MAVAKLPAAVAILGDAGKVSAIFDVVPVGPHLKLVIRNTHDGQIRRERIYAQIFAPLQLNMFDCERDLRKPGRNLCAICKSDFSVDGHEECRRVGKLLAPSCRAVLRDVMSHVAHERSHALIHRSRALGRKRLRLAGYSVLRAGTCECQRCQQKDALQRTDGCFHIRNVTHAVFKGALKLA